MPHYYDEKQETPVNPFQIPIVARGQELQLWSGSGVFSRKGLDRGTKLLIDKCMLQEGWKVHDLGCGIGVVGIVVKLSEPSCNILCSDVSERAVFLARKNVKERGLKISVRKSDGYEKIPEKFDTILLNPPYVAGRKTIYRLLDEAHSHLNKGGLLQVVARHTKGGEMLKKYLLQLFDNCDDSCKKGGFRVYVSKL